MGDKMEKLGYTLNPLEHSNHSGENVLLTICESSEGSQDLIPAVSDDVQYEVRNSDGILQYRLVNTSPENCSQNGHSIITPGNSQSTIQPTNCQFFVINELPANRPCLITPKIEDTSPINRHLIVGTSKKRDEKRRATHNEVERRRRDKINQWIFKLKDLLPSDSSETKSKASGGDSKGGILIKACEHIRAIQEQNKSLRECLKESEKISLEIKVLKEENEKLRKENEHLIMMMDRKDVKLENDYEYDSS